MKDCGTLQKKPFRATVATFVAADLHGDVEPLAARLVRRCRGRAFRVALDSESLPATRSRRRRAPVLQPAPRTVVYYHAVVKREPLTDDELVEAARCGDQSAFEVLVGRHMRAACARAQKILWSAEDAEEVASDAFLHAYRALSRFRGDAKFRTWLLTIVTWRAIDRLRAERGRIRKTAAEKKAAARLLLCLDELPKPLAGTDRSPEERLAAAEEYAAVRRLIAGLSPKLEKALMLSRLELTDREAAALLGIRVGTLKWRRFEARRQLRRRMRRAGLACREVAS